MTMADEYTEPTLIIKHKLKRLTPAVLDSTRRATSAEGFGSSTGITRVCSCGYATRSGNAFADHLERNYTQITHRLLGTSYSLFWCACGRSFTTLPALSEHVSGKPWIDRSDEKDEAEIINEEHTAAEWFEMLRNGEVHV